MTTSGANYHTHVESSTGEAYDLRRPRSAGDGEMLLARYDLERIRRDFSPRDFECGTPSLWRYAPLLPVDDVSAAVTLGEGFTPLLEAPRLARTLGLGALMVKDEGRNPSGTFKDRGSSVAVSRYAELGVRTVALNSSGNAGGSWSIYAARAGITSVNILPHDAQPSSLQQCRASRQPTFLMEMARWHDAGRFVAEACERNGWLNICTLKEPYRMEGKKTMGLEIAEQSGWKMPDAIVYPMGGGLGALAIYKAFDELRALGWIEGAMPRLYVTQYEGCAPVVKAYDEQKDVCEPWGRIDIPPGGLKSPNPPGGRAVLELMRRHGGGALAVSADEAFAAVDDLAQSEGIFSCPESATTLVGLRKACARGWVRPGERVVLVNTGSGLKSIPLLPQTAFAAIASSADIRA